MGIGQESGQSAPVELAWAGDRLECVARTVDCYDLFTHDHLVSLDIETVTDRDVTGTGENECSPKPVCVRGVILRNRRCSLALRRQMRAAQGEEAIRVLG